MGIKIPLTNVLDFNDAGDTGAASSTAGGVARTFTVPQDTENIVVKFTASTVAGGASCFLQTTDDGGTTWYDVARTSIVSNATNATAQWINATVGGGGGLRSGVTYAGASIITAGIGQVEASTLGTTAVSGMPILGTLNRIFIVYTGNVTTVTLARAQVKANGQSAGR